MSNSVQDDFYYLEDVPWTMYFDEARALHGAYWHNGFGYPHSHGCVNLSDRGCALALQLGQSWAILFTFTTHLADSHRSGTLWNWCALTPENAYGIFSPLLDPWCSGQTCGPVKAEIAGSNPVGSAEIASSIPSGPPERY